MNKCIFSEAWHGKCGKAVEEGFDPSLCLEHRRDKYKCWCGEPGVKQCGHSGFLVCGRPSCEDHYCNVISGTHPHNRTGRQQYTDWKRAKERQEENIKKESIKTITKEEYYQLCGLLAMAEKYDTLMEYLLESALDITGEDEEMGHTCDAIYDSKRRDVDRLLERLEIEADGIEL